MGLSDAIKRMKDRRGINKDYRAKKREAKKLEKEAKKESKLGDQMIEAEEFQQKADWKAKKSATAKSKRSAYFGMISSVVIIILLISFLVLTVVSYLFGAGIFSLLYLLGFVIYIMILSGKGAKKEEGWE